MKKNNSFFSVTLIIIISVFLLLPLFVTLLNSFFRDLSNIIPQGFTLDFYKDTLSGNANVIPSLGRSLLIAIIPTFVLLLLILLAMYVVQIYYPKFDKYLDLLSKIPYGIQGIILAVSIISLYASSNTILSNRVLLLSCAYCIIILPYMYQGIKNVWITIDVIPILEAAEILGSNKLYAYFKIIVPSMLKGLLATILLSIGILFGDFVLVNIIAGSYYKTINIFMNEIRSKSGHAASAISVIIFIVMFMLSFVANKFNKSDKDEQIKDSENFENESVE